MNNLFKKVVLAGLISGALSSFVFAESNKNNDLLHRLSNGEISDYSNGVELLNKKQREKVVGGLNISSIIMYDSGAQIGNGRSNYTNGYYLIDITAEENLKQRLNISGYTNTSVYEQFKWLTIVNPAHEKVAMFLKYNNKTKQYTSEVVVYNTKTNNTRSVFQSNPAILAINQRFKNEIVSDFLKRVR